MVQSASRSCTFFFFPGLHWRHSPFVRFVRSHHATSRPQILAEARIGGRAAAAGVLLERRHRERHPAGIRWRTTRAPLLFFPMVFPTSTLVVIWRSFGGTDRRARSGSFFYIKCSSRAEASRGRPQAPIRSDGERSEPESGSLPVERLRLFGSLNRHTAHELHIPQVHVFCSILTSLIYLPDALRNICSSWN